MAKFIQIIRNNWKKSTVGAVALVYGINYAHEQYKIDQLMRTYCEEAVRYGDVPVSPTLKPRHVTVILNPAANRRKAKSNFEKYCAPLLNLAGFTVDVVQTESEGQARSMAAKLQQNTDIIVVAGGDGTLSETVTGVMRAGGSMKCPVAVLPLGRTNSVASALQGRDREGVASPGEMAAAAMNVVRGHTRLVDLIRVDVIQDEEGVWKPVYGLSGLRWGMYRDAVSSQDRYWYVGALRGYLSVLMHTLSVHHVSAHVIYTPACVGCSRCYQTRSDLQPGHSRRWYQYLIPTFSRKPPEEQHVDYRQVVNANCGIVSEVDLSAVDINLTSPCVSRDSAGVEVTVGPANPSWTELVEEGWRRVRGLSPTSSSVFQAQQLQIIPTQEAEEKWYSIDSEEYEVRPIRVTLVPKSIQIFSPQPAET